MGVHIAAKTGVSAAPVSRVLRRVGLSRMRDLEPADPVRHASMGVKVKRVMADNGSYYISGAFKKVCEDLRIRHIRTKPYTPKTNGKAPFGRLRRNRLSAMERFIQTALREWAYARAYDTSDQRADDLPRWTHLYNWHRPHTAVGSQPPTSRAGLNRNTLLRLHT